MSSDVRQLVVDAQAAEVKGDKPLAISLLRKAAEAYRDRNQATKALKMLRQIRRLEGVVEPDPDSDVMPFESETFEGPNPPRALTERGPVLADPSADAWCSFCCRPRVEVGALVASPTGTFICAQCVGTARALLGSL